MKKVVSMILAMVCLLCVLTGCEEAVQTGTEQNISDTKEITNGRKRQEKLGGLFRPDCLCSHEEYRPGRGSLSETAQGYPEYL